MTYFRSKDLFLAKSNLQIEAIGTFDPDLVLC
jgi:hypothetical protein